MELDRSESLTSQSNDGELIRRVRSGETDAIESFLPRLICVRRVLAKKNSQSGNVFDPGEFEDLVQDTLVAVWEKLDRFAGYGSLEAWLYRFACLQFLAKWKKHRRVPQRLSPERETGLMDTSRDPQADRLEFDHVYQLLEDLGPPENLVIQAKGLEGLTFEEIASRTQVPLNTVKARYYRGLDKLRGMLRETRTGTLERRES